MKEFKLLRFILLAIIIFSSPQLTFAWQGSITGPGVLPQAEISPIQQGAVYTYSGFFEEDDAIEWSIVPETAGTVVFVDGSTVTINWNGTEGGSATLYFRQEVVEESNNGEGITEVSNNLLATAEIHFFDCPDLAGTINVSSHPDLRLGLNESVTASIAAPSSYTTVEWFLIGPEMTPLGETPLPITFQIPALQALGAHKLRAVLRDDCGNSLQLEEDVIIVGACDENASLSLVTQNTDLCLNTGIVVELIDAFAGDYAFSTNAPGATIVTNLLDNTATITFTESGSFQVTATPVNPACTEIVNLSIDISAPIESVEGDRTVCDGFTKIYTVNGGDYAHGVEWTLPGGVSMSSLNDSDTEVALTFTYVDDLPKTITVANPDANCGSSSVSFEVMVLQQVPKVSDITVDNAGLISNNSGSGMLELTTNSCTDIYGDCGTTLSSLDAFVKFSLGTDNYFSESTDPLASIEVDIVALGVDDNVIFEETGVSLSLNKLEPLQVYYLPLRGADAQNVRTLKVTQVAGSYSTHADIDAEKVTLQFYYEEVAEVDAALAPLELVVVPELSGAFEQTFEWSVNTAEYNCSEVPGYQIQMMRLYGSQLTNPLKESDWRGATNMYSESPETNLMISIAQGSGTYAWRVRPIGSLIGNAKYALSNPANWSDESWVEARFDFTQPEEDKNFIYSRTFTEKSKVRENLGFANGLGQVAQQQVKRHEETDQIIATQTVQDYSGRNALTTLPVPLQGISTFGYRNSLLRNGANNYTQSDFDVDPQNAASAQVYGNYYDGTISEVASAEGVPFIRDVFTNDGTGRLREQAGAGRTHALTADKASRRTTRTYYSSVEEGELIAIFGKEAPDATNVHKIISYDGNNVGKVTYLDKSGRMIATALDAGAVSDALDKLDSNPIESGDGPRTIIGKVEGNTRTGTYQVSSQKPLFFTSEKVVTINYGITPATVDALCGILCTTCDYKIEFLLHNQDDPSVLPVELGTHIINPVDCGSNTRVDIPAPIVTDPLEPEVNYVLERRISTHQKTDDPENPGEDIYYLDLYLRNIEVAYNDAVDALIADLQTEISSGDVQALYDRLEGTGYNLELVDGEYAVPIVVGSGAEQCTEYIFIPRVEDCEEMPDPQCRIDGMLWEAYFQTYWTEKGEDFGTPVNGVLPFAYFVDLQKKYDEEVLSMNQSRDPDETQYVFYYAVGELDQMIQSLLADNSDRLSCEDVWSAWKEQVAIYKIMTESVGSVDAFGNPYAPESFEKSLINRFLVGLEVLLDSRKPEDSSDPCAPATDGSPTYMVKDLAYGTLDGNSFPSSATYPDLKLEAHRLVFIHDVDNPNKLAYAASLAGVDPASFTVGNFDGLTSCDQYKVYANDDVEFGTDVQRQLNRTNAINTCNGWCLDRSEEFRQAVIEELIKENASYRIQHYRVVESDVAGSYVAIYDSELNSDVFDYSECEIQTMVDALVANCQANYCNLTLTDGNGDPVEMSEADILKVEQVFNYDFELNLNTSGASCTSGYDQVDTDLSVEGPSAFTQLWMVNDLDPNCSIEQQVMSTFDETGNIYAVLVPRYGELYYTLNNGVVINDSYGEGAFAVVKFDADGVYQWHKQYTFELQDQIFYQTPPSVPAPSTLPGFEPANIPVLPGDLSLSINENGDVSFVVNVFSRDDLVAESETWKLFDQNNNQVLEFSTTSKTSEASCSNDFVSNAIAATLTGAGAARWFRRYDTSGTNFNTLDTDGNAYVLRSDKLPVSIEKIAPDGTVLWVSETLSQSGVGQATGKNGEISLDPSGNTYFYNEFTTTASTVPLTVSGQTVATLPANTTTGVVVRYDVNGDFSWVYTLPAGATGFTKILARTNHVLIVSNQGTELDVRAVYSPLLVTQHALTGLPALGSISLWPLAGDELAVYSNSIVNGGVNSVIINLNDYSFSTDFDLSPSKFINVTDAYFQGASKLYIGTSKSISEINEVDISAGGWLAPAHASGFLCGITTASPTGNTRVEDPRFCFKWTTERSFDLPGDDIIAFDPQLPDLCRAFTMDEILEKIETQKLALIHGKQTAFKESYDSRCVDPELFSDEFTVNYTIDLHHYMLYYYDRFENLISTVPPAGVVKLDVSDKAALEAAKELIPNHSLRTFYQYNSLGQMVSQDTPDEGITNFIYNDVGQLRFSQDAQQRLDGKYSYTIYDGLNRVIEIGEAMGDFDVTARAQRNDLNWPSEAVGIELSEVTRTVYSMPYDQGLPAGYSQSNFLRNRVSYTYLDEDGKDDSDINDRVTTIYSYDPHGNIEWLIQDIPGLGQKTIDYEYDLLSGNVSLVAYNKNGVDQFFHRYTYDQDNRVRMVETSKDNIVWDRDANYDYYAHGPMNRSTFGEDKIQQQDYLYTIHGWLKAINDPSTPEGTHTSITRDAYAMVLHYYSGDYVHSSGGIGRLAALPSAGDPDVKRDLYNGNISAWENANQNKTGVWTRSGMQYSYDQLNRVKNSTFNIYRQDTDLAVDHFFPRVSFATDYKYDGNGNLLNLNRDDFDGDRMDQLVYNFETGKNKLTSVLDESTVPSDKHLDDIEGMNDYHYDAVGNLIQDLGSGLSIDWTVYGKVKSTLNSNGTETSFIYDAAGHRVAKHHTDENGAETTDFYVTDGKGNVMAIYRGVGVEGEPSLYEVPLYGGERIGMFRPGEQEGEATTPTSYVTITGDYQLSEWENVSKYYLEPSASFKLLPGFDNEGQAFEITGSIETEGNVYSRVLSNKLYELKDHLGNIRTTVSDVKQKAPEGLSGFIPTVISSLDYYPFGLDRTPVVWEEVEYLATFETDNETFEVSAFENRAAANIATADIHNNTPDTPERDATNSQLLEGSEGSFLGISKILPIQAGDKISMEVFGKYVTSTSPNPYNVAANLVGSLLNRLPLSASELQATDLQNSVDNEFTNIGRSGISNNDGVSAYLNYLLLDKNFEFVSAGYELLPANADDSFQKLEMKIIPEQDGYVYVYLTNESQQLTSVYFDDFKVMHEVLVLDPQLEQYRYGFQGQETDNEIKGPGNSINYKYRMHDPRIGRFFAVDPLTADYPFYSPYAFSGNRVVDAYELEGLEPVVSQGYLVGYRVKEGQGPTQIAQDINNPETQKLYGYQLQTGPVDWFDNIVNLEQNAKFMMGAGKERLFMGNNPNYFHYGFRALNMNPGDVITVTQPDPVFIGLTQIRPTSNEHPFTTPEGAALNVAGASFEGLSTALATDRWWLGKNGKYYGRMTGKGPNQHTGSRSAVMKNSRYLKNGGRFVTGVSIGYGLYTMREGYIADGGEYGYNFTRATAQTTGGLAGAIAVGKAGAGIGFLIAGPPGAAVGAFVGGIIGGFAGDWAGGTATDLYYNK